jgi:hypothetical protein
VFWSLNILQVLGCIWVNFVKFSKTLAFWVFV